jgi:hypothetical protein
MITTPHDPAGAGLPAKGAHASKQLPDQTPVLGEVKESLPVTVAVSVAASAFAFNVLNSSPAR